MASTPYALGRLVFHDPRSKSFRAAIPGTAVKTVAWRHHGVTLDQKQLGSCTGNAFIQTMMTEPFYIKGRNLNERKAIEAYSVATQEDGLPGTYPPDDSGSSGLGVCKAGVKLGYIDRYGHAFGLAEAKAAIQAAPMIAGLPWYDGMFTPSADGELVISGPVVGGHEIELLGYNQADDRWSCLTSWGKHFGVAMPECHVRGGGFYLSSATLDTLLGQQGDLSCPVPKQ